MNKKRHPALSAIIVILLLIVIMASLITNLVFTMSKNPHFFGYYITIQETNDMEPDINQGTAVISKAINSSSAVTEGTKVLCTLPDGSTGIRYIYHITEGDNGETSYIPATIAEPEKGSQPAIQKGNIIALCTIKSDELAAFIKFARSFYGIAALMILPCVILVIMLIAAISRASKYERAENDDAFERKYSGSSKRKNSPDNDFDDFNDDYNDEFEDDEFYDDYTAPSSGSDLEKKKSSIARNFERKKVDTNSPYQKAVERERTMQFKAQKNGYQNLNSFGDESDMTPKYAASIDSATQKIYKPSDKHVSMSAFPPAEDIKVTDYNKTQHIGAHEKLNYEDEEDTVINTQSTDDETESSDIEKKVNEIRNSRPHKKPNIDDILISTSSDDSDYVRPKHDDINSIDELIAVIENEKKKLK